MHVKTDEDEGLVMKADSSLVRNSFLYDCTQPYAGPLLLMTALVCALKASQPDLHPNISPDMYLLRPRSGIGVPHLERGTGTLFVLNNSVVHYFSARTTMKGAGGRGGGGYNGR